MQSYSIAMGPVLGQSGGVLGIPVPGLCLAVPGCAGAVLALCPAAGGRRGVTGVTPRVKLCGVAWLRQCKPRAPYRAQSQSARPDFVRTSHAVCSFSWRKARRNGRNAASETLWRGESATGVLENARHPTTPQSMYIILLDWKKVCGVGGCPVLPL